MQGPYGSALVTEVYWHSLFPWQYCAQPVLVIGENFLRVVAKEKRCAAREFALFCTPMIQQRKP